MVDKTIYLIAVIFTLTSCGNKYNSEAKTDLLYKGIKGSVHLLKHEYLNDDNEFIHGYVEAFDTSGNTIAMHYYGATQGKFNYLLSYDSLKNIIGYEQFIDNSFFTKGTNIFDENQNLVLVVDSNKYGEVEKIKYSYDSLGFDRVKSYMPNNERIEVYNYTNEGLLKFYEKLDSGKSVLKREYFYKDNILYRLDQTKNGKDVEVNNYSVTALDSLHNWTERKVFTNDSLKQVERRSMEYY